METLVKAEGGRNVQVLSDLEAISHEAASLFINASRDSIAARKKFVVAISGGSTPRRLYTLLSSSPCRDQVDWQKVHFFWADERCVRKEDGASNFKTVYDRLLSKVPIPNQNIHRIKGEEEPEKAARDYEADIKEFFGGSGLPVFDLVLLGMGEDGHTASLFPGSKSLEETARLVIPVYAEKPNQNRVTLTLAVLNNAAQILFLVAGTSKATVLSEILKDENKRREFPAGRIRPVRGTVIWLIDQEAAGTV
jgi:6-phosphogluconolactonase